MKRDDIQFPERHVALREDVHALGGLVGEILREQGGEELFGVVELDRTLAIRRRNGDVAAAADLALRVRDREPALARDLVRSFSLWFQAVNLAEKVHRIRRRREYFLVNSARPQPGGIQVALAQLKERGMTLEQVLDLLSGLSIEPVFTAHPTESTRRTILRKQLRVAELMFDRLDPTLAPNESRAVWGRIRHELTTAWQTEDHPRERLTVADEREHVLFYLAEVLYRVVPAFYDEISDALEKLYNVPAEAARIPVLIRFGTWVGGDMDGNPDVNAKSLRETMARSRQVVVNAYFLECQELAQKLSQSASRVGISDDLQRRIDNYMTLIPGARSAIPARHDRMPYRVFFGQLAERLRLTWDGRPNGYQNPAQFAADVSAAADSLLANRGRHAGYFPVQRLLRRVATFGFHLAAIDVRQHTDVHHQVLAQGFDDPAWLTRSRRERHTRIVDAIRRDLGPKIELDAVGRRSLGVFEDLAQAQFRYGRDAIGYYVVSGAAGSDDVLAPLLLARWAGIDDPRTESVPLDVAPLFESTEALRHSGEVMGALLQDPVYRAHLESRDRRQCVLVGYSDSSKQAGLCASRIAVHEAQEQLSHTLHQAHEKHVIFHARGGSIPRGGNRVDTLVRVAPPEAVNGILRLTEQGEVVSQNYGLRPIAMRTLERAFNSLVTAMNRARIGALDNETARWRDSLRLLASASEDYYRHWIWDDKRCYTYFRQATPIDVIERMQIGSRPSYRPDRQGLEGLRAVPWVYAWTQSRLILPGWFGAGTGLAKLLAEQGVTAARELYASWPFFQHLIDDVEAMLARTDIDIARAYSELSDAALRPVFDEACAEHQRTLEAVLSIKAVANLLDGETTLQRSIQLRNPYVDPMNLMQVDLLRRWRASGRTQRDLFDALLASITGIAQGLQSTG
jgi:phosphoenolpyruvate carboxylase